MHQIDIVRRPMPLGVNFECYNNHNLHAYAPYVTDEETRLLIDREWWDSLTSATQDQIRASYDFTLTEVAVPHPVCPPSAVLTAIYWLYLESFDYQRWYSPDMPDGPKDVVIIPLDQPTKSQLRGGDSNIPALLQRLEEVCDGREFFVRLSGTSGKNERPVRPFTSPFDIMQHLARVRLFKSREYEREKETCLILVPWNDSIDPGCEFRIFVVNGRLTAASPQQYWDLHQYSSAELEAFETAFSQIAFLSHTPYHTFVADVYVDVETATCHLIELNPFGAHCGAGASFFNWIDDYALLYGLFVPPITELRYLSAIGY